MNEQELQELKKKLGEFAGFKLADDSNYLLAECPIGYPLGFHLPDFTQSIDACFKWLYPKLKERLSFLELEAFMKLWVNSFVWRKEKPSLSLCLAIEKLINSGV